LSPKAALFLGHWLATTLGVGGESLARTNKQSATGKRARAGSCMTRSPSDVQDTPGELQNASSDRTCEARTSSIIKVTQATFSGLLAMRLV
jgi:hypothetical protein